MFDANPYLLEKTPEYRRATLYHLANERSWLENIARLGWLVLRTLLRALGHVLIGLGRLLLRLPATDPAHKMPLSYAMRD